MRKAKELQGKRIVITVSFTAKNHTDDHAADDHIANKSN